MRAQFNKGKDIDLNVVAGKKLSQKLLWHILGYINMDLKVFWQCLNVFLHPILTV